MGYLETRLLVVRAPAPAIDITVQVGRLGAKKVGSGLTDEASANLLFGGFTKKETKWLLCILPMIQESRPQCHPHLG